MYKMQCGDMNEFESCFSFACPKFLSPCPPDPDAPIDDYGKDATKHQTQVFMDEVRNIVCVHQISVHMYMHDSGMHCFVAIGCVGFHFWI